MNNFIESFVHILNFEFIVRISNYYFSFWFCFFFLFLVFLFYFFFVHYGNNNRNILLIYLCKTNNVKSSNLVYFIIKITSKFGRKKIWWQFGPVFRWLILFWKVIYLHLMATFLTNVNVIPLILFKLTIYNGYEFQTLNGYIQ